MIPGPWLELFLVLLAAWVLWGIAKWVRTGAADARDLEQEKAVQKGRRAFREQLEKNRARLRRLVDNLRVPKPPDRTD